MNIVELSMVVLLCGIFVAALGMLSLKDYFPYLFIRWKKQRPYKFGDPRTYAGNCWECGKPFTVVRVLDACCKLSEAAFAKASARY